MNPQTPQTADQINTPQTGQVKISKTAPGAAVATAKAPAGKIKLPELPKRPPIVKPEPPPPPKGWWNCPDFRGTRDGVKNAITAATEIPDRWKAVLTGEIDDLPAELNHVKLDVHYHTEDQPKISRRNCHFSIVASQQLL